MKNISKKQIRKSIVNAIDAVLFEFRTSLSSRKGQKLLDTFSKKYATEVKKAIKKSTGGIPKEQKLKRKTATKK